MSTLRKFRLLACLWLACAGAPASAQKLTLEPCRLAGLAGLGSVAAECGRLAVPENPDAPGGRQIELYVARVAALNNKPAASAFTVIAGGPGQASTELYVSMRGAFEEIRRERDIVLVDQRGTGQSNPLRCELGDGDLLEYDSAALRPLIKKCLAALDGEPRFYTTSVAVRDLDTVRAALGYAQLDIYGVSYGTRVALHYLRRYPERARTVILDGVAPADMTLGPGIAIDAQVALDALFARCAGDAACAANFPDLPTHFATLQARVRAAPVPVDFADPLTGKPMRLEFGYPHLMSAVRLMAYSPATLALLPLVLHEAATNDNFVPLATQYETQVARVADSLAAGMHNSVVCAEDVPFFAVDAATRDRLAATYMGTVQVDVLVETCEIWPRGPLDEGFKEPVKSANPVLLLSGDADPITPPANAEQALRTLRNGRHLIGAGQGHGLAPIGCVPRLMARFVAGQDAHALDKTCLEVQAASPFFTSFVGTEP